MQTKVIVAIVLLCNSFLFQSNRVKASSQLQIPVNLCCPDGESYRIGLDDCRKLKISTNKTILINSLNVKDNEEILNFSYKLLPCPEGFIGHTTANFTFNTNNGSLEADQHYLDSGEFCFDQIQMDSKSPMEFIARFCLPDPCHEKNCIRKCCPDGSVFNATRRLCQKSEVKFELVFQYENDEVIDPLPNIEIGKAPQCFHGKHVYHPDMFNLLPDGRFYEKTFSLLQKPIITRNYCVDNYVKGSSMDLKAMLCASPPPSPEQIEYDKTVRITYAYFLLFSSVFVILTFIVYSLLEDLRNIHGVTIMSYLASMTSMYVGIGIVLLIPTEAYFPRALCLFFAVLAHFSILATFTWLNTVSFDIWLTFNSMWPRDQRRNQHHRLGATFIFYSLYAWGLPFIIVLVGQILDNIPNVPDHISKPGFGEEFCRFHRIGQVLDDIKNIPGFIIKPNVAVWTCWFYKRNQTSLWLYLYGPMTILIGSNIVLFIFTAIYLQRESQDIAIAGRRSRVKQRFKIIVSLFFLMGVPWITEMITFAVKVPFELTIMTDILNILTGVYIFIIFVCKSRVWNLLKMKFPFLEYLDATNNCESLRRNLNIRINEATGEERRSRFNSSVYSISEFTQSSIVRSTPDSQSSAP